MTKASLAILWANVACATYCLGVAVYQAGHGNNELVASLFAVLALNNICAAWDEYNRRSARSAK